jgi:hypothetical protein
VPNPLAALPRLSRADQYKFLRYCHWLHLCEYFLTPKPIVFALRATACMFALLLIMPAHPLAIPAVIGGGISFAFLSRSYNPMKEKIC